MRFANLLHTPSSIGTVVLTDEELIKSYVDGVSE